MGLGADINHILYTTVKYYKSKTLNLQKKEYRMYSQNQANFLLYALLFHALNSLFLHIFKESTVRNTGNVPKQQGTWQAFPLLCTTWVKILTGQGIWVSHTIGMPKVGTRS